MTTDTTRRRRTPEQMIADLQAQLAIVKARAEKEPPASSESPTPSTEPKNRRVAMRAKPRSKPAEVIPAATSTSTASLLTNSLHAEIQACVDAFSVDLVELIQRTTLEAVQRGLGEIAQLKGSQDATDNEPRFRPIPLRAPTRSPNPAATSKSNVAAPLSFKHYERMAIERALAECGGNAIEAGKRLGLTKSATYRRIGALGIQKPSEGGKFSISAEDPIAHAGEPVSLDAYEKAVITRAIDECGGNVVAAAKLLKAGKSTLYRRMEALRIARGKMPGGSS